MRVIPLSASEYALVEEVLAVDPDETALEPVAGIDCSEEDIEAQREDGDADPMVTIELIAQWVPEGQQGILDWFFVRESGQNEKEPIIEHGGPLLAFAYAGDDPDFDALLPDAVTVLNEQVGFLEFELSGEEEE